MTATPNPHLRADASRVDASASKLSPLRQRLAWMYSSSTSSCASAPPLTAASPPIHPLPRSATCDLLHALACQRSRLPPSRMPNSHADMQHRFDVRYTDVGGTKGYSLFRMNLSLIPGPQYDCLIIQIPSTSTRSNKPKKTVDNRHLSLRASSDSASESDSSEVLSPIRDCRRTSTTAFSRQSPQPAASHVRAWP